MKRRVDVDKKPVERITLRPEEAAEALGISRATVYRLIATGALPSIHLGKCLRVPVEALRSRMERTA